MQDVVLTKNSKGPNIEPWGTQQLVSSRFDLNSPTDTNCLLIQRKDVNHLLKILLMLEFSSFQSSIS